MQDAILVLQDGKYFLGRSIGKEGKCIGEICFTTGITGYQHTITDPSFANQIIMFTFPHIGNIGINKKDNEGGRKIVASGIIVRELSYASHPSSCISLDDWLKRNDVVGISGVDTRALTRHLQKYRPQSGIICKFSVSDAERIYSDRMTFVIKSLLNELRGYKPLNGIEIINKVSLSNNIIKNDLNAKYKVVVVDFGVKTSIISRLIELGCAIELIKPDEGLAKKVLSMNPDGVVLSNGPGNPQEIGKNVISEIDIIVKSKVPIFGICMGHQLLAITFGAKTFKMKVGHRGNNHPVYNINNRRIEITSQNHGFVVDPSSLPSEVEITHISLFDNSVEGIMVKNYPVFSVQYHPEEAPGTHDSHYLFRDFIKNIELYKM
ncbi:MAG: glutamine-hydrolyzing carbamoyl-phosphate synthase small subunit [Wolbachia endosymbiont of Menacanthus eurysternus]|nr:MAG: glutamine-hydrolyzing carbamoyl-phosphate synthase small subunit [Wolbachia endosymbiont of Menacanthus eurysternus]